MGKRKEGWEGEEGREAEAEGEGNRNHQRFTIQDLPSLHFVFVFVFFFHLCILEDWGIEIYIATGSDLS